MRCRHGLFLGLVMAVAAACSSGDDAAIEATSGGPEDLPATADVPEAQRRALADNFVSLAEYQEAFVLFRDCGEGTGSPIVIVDEDPASGLVMYATASPLSTPGADPVGSLDVCYQRYFSYVELAFQTGNPEVLASLLEDQLRFFDSEVRPCLESQGVLVGEVVPGTEQYGELSRQAMQLENDGLC